MRSRERAHGFNTMLVLISTCVLFFYLFSYQITSKHLFFPHESSYGEDDSIIQFEAEDGTKLAAYWEPIMGAKWTVLYFHGNAEDIGDVQFILRNYQLRGFNVLCLDYRGFGLSEGKANERNTFADANALLEYGKSNLGLSEDHLVLHGRSIGGGVAMELASKRNFGGLILESTFLSVFQMYLPVRWVPGDKFVNSRKASKVKCPTLVIHGREDDVVKFEHGEKLASMIDEDLVTTLWVPGVGHNDLVTRESELYWSTVERFLRSLN